MLGVITRADRARAFFPAIISRDAVKCLTAAIGDGMFSHRLGQRVPLFMCGVVFYFAGVGPL